MEDARMKIKRKIPRRGGLAALGACCALLGLSAIALAAQPPKPAKAFTTKAGRRGKLSLTLVTSADGKKIEEGEAAIGSQFALSGGSVSCPKAKKEKGFHETPFALFGFPRTTLKPTGGKYGFSARVVQREATVLGSTAKSFTLKVKVAGTVVNPTTIKGTVSAKGGRCTTKKPLPYVAKVNPKVPVAPGK
jgi:hypothetical protein